MDEPQKHNATFRIPDVRGHIFWLYLRLFTLVVLNLSSLFYSNLYTLYLDVFIFIFILLRVLWLCRSVWWYFLLILEMSVVIFSSTSSTSHFLSSHSAILITLRLFYSILQISYPKFLLLFIFFFSFQVWILFYNLSSSSFTISSMVYNLLISPLK